MTEHMPVLPPKTHYVLLITATVMEVESQNAIEAAHRALLESPRAIDPTQLQWYVRHVSEEPITIADDSIDQEMVERGATDVA